MSRRRDYHRGKHAAGYVPAARCAAIVAWLRHHPDSGVMDVAIALDITERAARRALHRLWADGEATRQALPTSARVYRVSGTGPALSLPEAVFRLLSEGPATNAALSARLGRPGCTVARACARLVSSGDVTRERIPAPRGKAYRYARVAA